MTTPARRFPRAGQSKLPAGEDHDLRFAWQLRPGKDESAARRRPHGIEASDLCQKFVEGGLREDVHRNDDFRPDLAQDFNHVVLVECPGAVDRHHDDVDRPEFGEVGLRQRVMQMAEMGDAQISDLEDKDGVSVIARAAEFSDISRNIVDAHITVFEAMGRDTARGIPAAQDVFDARLDRIAVMRRMGVVHRHDVRRHRRPYRVVVIGDDANSARALDQEARMTEKADRNRIFRAGSCKAQRPPGNDPAARRLRRAGEKQC